jgi:hypothetical protein
VNEPLLLNLSLPKCGTLSVREYFSDYKSSHELFSQSFLAAMEIAERYNQPEIVAQMLQRRYQHGLIEIDTSGFLHTISSELLQLFPKTSFLRVIREPRSWISSYLDMLGGKAQELTSQKKPIDNRAALFEHFYVSRIFPRMLLADMLELKTWTRRRRNKAICDAAKYWAKDCERALNEKKHSVVTTCSLDQLSAILPSMRAQISGKVDYSESDHFRAKSRHNVSDRGETRQIIESWLQPDELAAETIESLDNCDHLHKRIINCLQSRDE